MHENHMYMGVPLLVAVAGRSPRLALLAAGCSIAVFLNATLHDPLLPELKQLGYWAEFYAAKRAAYGLPPEPGTEDEDSDPEDSVDPGSEDGEE